MVWNLINPKMMCSKLLLRETDVRESAVHYVSQHELLISHVRPETALRLQPGNNSTTKKLVRNCRQRKTARQISMICNPLCGSVCEPSSRVREIEWSVFVSWYVVSLTNQWDGNCLLIWFDGKSRENLINRKKCRERIIYFVSTKFWFQIKWSTDQ